MTLKVTLVNETATPAIPVDTVVQWLGGTGVFMAVASAWNGATVTLEYQLPDGATWVAAGQYTTLTQNGGGIFNLPAGTKLQVAITGGVPTGLICTASVLQGN